MARARRRAAVSDAEWDVAIRRFHALRDLEDPDALRRAQRLRALARREAQDVYDVANLLERGESVEIGLTRLRPQVIVRRLIRRGHFAGDVIAEYLERWGATRAHETEMSIEALRERAGELWKAADVLSGPVDTYVRLAREARGGPTGRFPSVGLDYLVEKTNAWGATIRETVEQLIARGAKLPERRGESEEADDEFVRWFRILKSARSRTRSRNR